MVLAGGTLFDTPDPDTVNSPLLLARFAARCIADSSVAFTPLGRVCCGTAGCGFDGVEHAVDVLDPCPNGPLLGLLAATRCPARMFPTV